MTREEAIKDIQDFTGWFKKDKPIYKALDMAIKALEQKPCDVFDKYGNYKYPSDVELTEPNTATSTPCDDVVSRKAVDELSKELVPTTRDKADFLCNFWEGLQKLPSVRPQEQTGHCKDCKYFEYDSVANVDGVPLIVAHEICNKWGDGCKTREDGYCFLYEPQESEDK